jgi:competence ComEA-like helix-hairpin-helix protein
MTVAFGAVAWADLPPGAGKEETLRACSRCHSPELVTTQHQGRDQWQLTISKMANLGAEANDNEFEAILDYLASHFGPEAVQPVNVNKATAVEIECVLALTRPESKAIVRYREQNGTFKSVDDLSHVPGLDFKKIAARKSLVLF